MGWDKAAEKRLRKALEADEVVTIERYTRRGEVDVQGDIEDALAEMDSLRARLVEMYERIIPEEIAKGCAQAEREAQAQRERADRAEARLADACSATGTSPVSTVYHPNPVECVAQIKNTITARRERADRLEAALTQAHLALQGAWALLPPEDGERLGIKRLMLECERPECAALAAQPAQEGR